MGGAGQGIGKEELPIEPIKELGIAEKAISAQNFFRRAAEIFGGKIYTVLAAVILKPALGRHPCSTEKGNVLRFFKNPASASIFLSI